MEFTIIKEARFTTPLAKFLYPKLSEPDTRFNPEGEYKVTALIDARDVGTLADELDNYLNEHKKSLKAQAPQQRFKLADLPWGFVEDNGQAYFQVKAKMKASGISRRDGKPWTAKPAIFDSMGRPCTDRESLAGMWSGTMGRVSFDAQAFYVPAIGAGVTLRLRAVQIISLVEGGGDAESYGFSSDEGGYAFGDAGTESPHTVDQASSGEVPFDSSEEIPADASSF